MRQNVYDNDYSKKISTLIVQQRINGKYQDLKSTMSWVCTARTLRESWRPTELRMYYYVGWWCEILYFKEQSIIINV